MAQPAPAYVHPAANPLEAPLNQLGNLLNTNYNNSWTLKQLINSNVQYILAQLDRIRQAVTQLQQNFAIARNRIPQLEAEIAALQAQLAAQGPGHPAPNVVALQQQIADLTAQRADYIRWINESLALINRYDGYVQHINGLAPNNPQFTALIGQINQRLRTITDLFNLPQNGQDPPVQPGNPPPPPGGPYGNGGPAAPGAGNPPPGGLGNLGAGNVNPGAGNVNPGAGNVNPGAGNRNVFQRGWDFLRGRNRGRNGAIAPGGNVAQANPLMVAPPVDQVRNVEPLPPARMPGVVDNSNRIRNMYRPYDSPSDSDDDSDEGSDGNFVGRPRRAARGAWNVMDDDGDDLSDVDLESNVAAANRSRGSSIDSNGGKRKRKRTRKQRKHKGGWRLSSNKRTSTLSSSRSSRTSRPSRPSRSSRRSRPTRSSRTSRTSRSSRRSSN
jgi:hypothetical protein